MTCQELVLIGVIAVIWIGLALATPAFLTAGSIRPLLVATAPIALIGVGMTIIIITGGIDVSVGGAIMVCSVVTAKALVGHMSLVPAVLLSVVVGGSRAPGFRRRSAQVAVQMEDGQTLAIGGLIQNSVSATSTRVPILGDLPSPSLPTP